DALVRAVEGDDQIVLREGGEGELLRAMLRAVVATAGEGIERAMIGPFAEMPVTRSGAARHDPRAESLSLREIAEHHLCHRRAADVPRAHEDHAEGIRGCHRPILPVEGRSCDAGYPGR